ncbi:TPA: hypothetical protein ACXDAY_002144 [Clostridium botulinum]|uniref:hypothetical protein n=1 Tax=Clostridium botulinum TaxID=1491 RepID=UPI00046798FA|nr:hypothetical protein [Clostridium botulinum]APH20839.1 hypothetical protein NPD1_4226 [Clostridium botulinum]APQ71150.1 hypothetical protein RSJ8_4183 [Clostridium botulinum]APR02428.1 hypothetical protein RSJ2_4044 [Clostridium botulinum]AUN01564.1 hypothetical protein RSJ19_00855 [Clostridium botulinum]MBN3352145.1 hypothetical protein [Clostridium botulinum]
MKSTKPKFNIGDNVEINFNILKKKLRKQQIYPQAFMEISQFNNNSIGQHVITRLSRGSNDVNSYNLDGDYMFEEDEINLLQNAEHIYYIYKIKNKVIEIFPVTIKNKAEKYCKVHRDWDFIEGTKVNTIQLSIYEKENKHIPFKIVKNRI